MPLSQKIVILKMLTAVAQRVTGLHLQELDPRFVPPQLIEAQVADVTDAQPEPTGEQENGIVPFPLGRAAVDGR